ncbi:putative siderophore transport system permease protein YfhA [compost metagenome]
MNRHITLRTRSGKISFLLDRKWVRTVSLLVMITCLVFILGLSIGSIMIHPFAVLKHLLGMGTGEYDFVINTHRLPRMLVSLLVGAALGLSGLILQGVIRNPLASPDIIGITGGASVGAIIFITYCLGTFSIKWLPLGAIVGAAVVSFAIYLLSWYKGVTPYRLVLIGIGMAAVTSALTTMMIVVSATDIASKAYIWMTGSVYGATWSHVQSMLVWVVVFAPLALLFSRAVNVQQLGDDVATGLGAKVELQRFGLLIVSVALAGSAVAYAGAIGFVGLIAPHAAKKLVNGSFGGLVPVTMLLGGIIVSVSDVVGRTAFLPLDIPAGVFTAGIGAPFFLYLLYKKRK